MKKYIFQVAAVSLMALVMTGCAKRKVVEDKGKDPILEEKLVEEAKDMLREFAITEDNAKLLGRTLSFSEVLWLAYSATGAEFQFHGTKCSIDFIGDHMATTIGEELHRARVGIFVNGELVADELIDSANKTIDVFESEEAKDVTVTVVKLSETTDSTVGIERVRVVGSSIQKTEEKALKIEFIGDSITCGYGVEEGLDSKYMTSNENATKAYAYKTAKALDADYSLVSISGYGIISGYTGDGIKNEEGLILPYYDKLGKSYGRFANTTPPEKLPWDFTKFVPDLIVINLGTNDASYCGTDLARCEEYRDGYIEFIKKVRSFNPDAKLLCTLGIMGDSLYPYLEEAVEAYKAESKDENITTMKFDEQLLEDGYAVDYHPTEITHSKAADKLTTFIQELLREEGGL